VKPALPTLELFHGPRRLFESAGRWLHPLFELEAFLAVSSWPRPELRGELEVRDKIVGKAAALLLVRLGIRRVHAGLLSGLGHGVLERNGVVVSADARIPRIACQTEVLLAEVDDPEEAYRLIRRRLEGGGRRYLRR
jgi:zinc transport system ATP-binding protein